MSDILHRKSESFSVMSVTVAGRKMGKTTVSYDCLLQTPAKAEVR